MAVDLEAIARRGRCDVSSLKIAVPLLEQGYTAPFLARYRRDELGGLDETTLWNLKAALEAEASLAAFREELHQTWESTPLADPSIGDAIRKSGSRRTLQRLSKRIRQENAAGVASDANRLAVRLLNPQKQDPGDPAAVAEAMESLENKQEAVAGITDAVVHRLAGDPRIISAAVRWLSKNAKIHISDVHDPHIAAAEAAEAAEASAKSGGAADADDKSEPTTEPADSSEAGDSSQVADSSPAAEGADTQAEAAPAESDATTASETQPASAETPAPEAGEAPAAPAAPSEPAASETETTAGAGDEQSSSSADQEPAADGGSSESPATPEAEIPQFAAGEGTKPEGKDKPKSAPKKPKKISPRQRRRRWLVNVLKPLEGKRLPATKLSAFQIVMLGRALRSQVAVCAFEYDAAKLVNEIKRVAVGLNRNYESQLTDLVMQHEADIREAGEAAWWDELHERASSRLVGVAADHLRDQVNRGPIESKVVMSIDAIGPKTAATAIVSADGRVLRGDDLPCQLSSNARSEMVAKMGELIHQYGVDLVIISNGPARRACLIALGELIGQSPSDSIRWTVADRSGADSYAGSDIANSEMRSTPRRFRAAAWLAFSILHPAQAYAKIDPLRLRLASFQGELSEESLAVSLGHIMSSGASRGGVDANAAPVTWLKQLPGMTEAVAKALVDRRETALLKSRNELLGLEGWQGLVESRQALPFLRVFESDEPLDGTLIHPDDYSLAMKLAKALEIELPPEAPPGYQRPSYDSPQPKAADEPQLVDATTPDSPAPVEDFDNAGEKAGEFSLPEGSDSADAPAASESEATPAESETPAAEEGASETGELAQQSPEQPAEQSPEPSAETESSEATPDAATEAEPQEEAAAAPAEEASESAAAESGESSEETAAASIPDPIRRPRPERAKIEKCIKEWQVGKHRVEQLVGWLCDPFGETAISDDPPAVLSTMPTLKTLKAGDQVIGVVVGVMNFGVFVELAPDCSGLIHVSRLSDGYVEDLNEAVQVGDVITAWVTGIDEKRRRVGLSALSPEQEERVNREQQERGGGGRGRGGGQRRGDGKGGRGGAREGGQGQRQGGQRQSGQGQPQRSGAGQGQGHGQGQSRGGGQGQGRGGQGRGGQGRGGQGQGQGRGGRGGQGRGQGRGGRDNRGQGRGGRKPRQLESYRVVAKPEDKPISDAMQKGDEPLRSFGDLMQFFSGKDEPQGDSPAEQKPPTEKAQAASAPQQSAPQQSAPQQSAPQQSAPQQDGNDTPPKPDSDGQQSAEKPPASPPPADAPVAAESTADNKNNDQATPAPESTPVDNSSGAAE